VNLGVQLETLFGVCQQKNSQSMQYHFSKFPKALKAIKRKGVDVKIVCMVFMKISVRRGMHFAHTLFDMTV
jgi:tryptophan synthase alpha subunit